MSEAVDKLLELKAKHVGRKKQTAVYKALKALRDNCRKHEHCGDCELHTFDDEGQLSCVLYEWSGRIDPDGWPIDCDFRRVRFEYGG